MAEPLLTKDQQEKLKKLETELAAKRKYEENSRERRIAASQKTGIPYDIVDIDVVRLGTMLGLIRNLETEKDPEDISLLDLFLGIGDKTSAYSYENIPPYFMLSSQRISEETRVSNHEEFVRTKCSDYWNFVSEFLTQEQEKVEKSVSLSLQKLSPETFVSAVKENMDVILEMIEEDCDDVQPHEQLKILRNSLVSVIPLCDYKKILLEQIHRVPRNINNLSYIDASLILFPGFETLPPQNTIGIVRSLIVRSHTKDPQLAPLNMSTIGKECCTPVVMFVHLSEVLKYTIIGPYANNSIGFMSNEFYILKCISGNVRMWIRDEHLARFSLNLRKLLHAYVTKTLTTVRSSSKSVTDIELRLVDALNLLKKPAAFRKLICSIIATYSPILPTEADVFDFIHGCENLGKDL